MSSQICLDLIFPWWCNVTKCIREMVLLGSAAFSAKILLQLDSLNQSNLFEKKDQYISINIKEVMSIQSF